MSALGVLLIGYESDLHLDRVVLELRRQNVSICRLDPRTFQRENLRFDHEISSDHVVMSCKGEDLCIDNKTSVFCRFALESLLYPVSGGDDVFIQSEFASHLLNSLTTISIERWINHPFQESFANLKTRQLKIALECGLLVPPSLISQDTERLKDFSDKHGSCVIKSLSEEPLELVENGQRSAGFTAELQPALLKSGAWDKTSPVFLQKLIRKVADIRVTVVDDTSFAAKIVSAPHSPIDFRNAESTTVEPFELPQKVERGLVNLVRKLGIRFASCDLGLCADGALWFFEANVCGNYLWTELEAGLPISRQIADSLQYPAKPTAS